MNAEMIARTIGFILAPAVMVTACAVTLNGLLTHYAAINDRLRVLVKERLELLRLRVEASPRLFLGERLEEIDAQLPELLMRHKLMRDSILLVFIAVLLYVVSMLVIALAAFGADWIATLALGLFLLGTAVLLSGTLLTAMEIYRSHSAVGYEVQQVSRLELRRRGI
ncbi:MAG: DUF2721 domain-containing protein [Thermaceae bacterium]|nr:DUF2721 domain-containing protein [Thermaceae bacterium]